MTDEDARERALNILGEGRARGVLAFNGNPATKEGDRVRLLEDMGEFSNVEVGDVGTVEYVSDSDVLDVRWDSTGEIECLSSITDKWELA